MPPKPYETPFDFGEAMIQPFVTTGGRAFAMRVWFWMTIPVVISLLIAVPMLLKHYGALMIWQAEFTQAALEGDPGDMAIFEGLGDIAAKMMPANLIMIAGGWIGAVMGEAALHRKVLLGQETPGRPVRFGADEFRVMGAQLRVWAILILTVVLGTLAASMLFSFAIAIAGPIGGALAAFSYLAVFYFAVHNAVRLMPTAALSVKTKGISLTEARTVTKDKFWQLFGAFVLVYVGGLIVASIVSQIGQSLVLGSGSEMADIMTNGGDLTPILDAAAQRMKNPAVIFGGVICTIAYGAVLSFWYLCLSGIGTYAVKWAHGPNVETAFD